MTTDPIAAMTNAEFGSYLELVLIPELELADPQAQEDFIIADRFLAEPETHSLVWGFECDMIDRADFVAYLTDTLIPRLGTTPRRGPLGVVMFSAIRAARSAATRLGRRS